MKSILKPLKSRRKKNNKQEDVAQAELPKIQELPNQETAAPKKRITKKIPKKDVVIKTEPKFEQSDEDSDNSSVEYVITKRVKNSQKELLNNEILYNNYIV